MRAGRRRPGPRGETRHVPGAYFRRGVRVQSFIVCYRSSFLRLELPRYRRTRTWGMQTRASRMKARRRRRTTMPRKIGGKHRKGLHAHWAPKFSPNSVHPRIVMPSLCNHNVQTPASSRVLGAPASTGLIQAHRESQALNHHRQNRLRWSHFSVVVCSIWYRSPSH